jgi:hypothetical protein
MKLRLPSVINERLIEIPDEDKEEIVAATTLEPEIKA